jgi:hypothetical protein
MALFDFNPDLGGAKGVLDARKAAVKNRDKDWNYKKYAYCTITSTGNSQTITCPAPMTIGDGSAPTGGGRSMYTSEGGIRRKKPILTSCTITNEGGQNYVDSYIYEAEFSFDVHTVADLDKAIKAFMQVGGEVKISFGWANAGAAGNSGEVLVNVYNFNWSLNKDGSFSCTVKAMSGSALFPKESMGGNSRKATPPEREALGDSTEVVGFFEQLVAGMRTAHGITAEDTLDDVNDVPWVPDFIAGGISDNQMISEHAVVEGMMFPFWVTEMLSSEGTWYNDDELYFSYTNLSSVVEYLNNHLKKTKSNIRYHFDYTGNASKLDTKQTMMFSADPTRIVLPGPFAKYGSKSNTDAANFAKWTTYTTQNNGGADFVGSILLELKYLNSIYAKLADQKEDKQGGGKVPPTIQEFMNQLFNDIADVTGGFAQLQAIPEKISQSESKAQNESTLNLIIVNRPMVPVSSSPSKYVFTTLAQDSIVRDVTFETDFDANTLMMATIGASGKSVTNIDDRIPGADCGKAASAGNADPVSAGDLEKVRASYGDDGFNQAKVSSNSDSLKKYLNQNKDTFAAGYKEIVWPYKLGVTIDGVADINYMAAITIDRLPSSMVSPKMYFSITSIEHKFDGQGDWETSLGTVMRIS